MCLYPKLITNTKYRSTKKNGGNIPVMKDKRVSMVPVGCGNCMECRKQKARAWSVRLQEEIRTKRDGKFVTLTFSNESIKEITDGIKGLEGYELDNEIAKVGVRRFLERWRKKYKVSVRHWLVTELGGNGTENIHLHGIIFSDKVEEIKKIWGYGYVYIGEYVNDRTINYCVKYSTKVDEKHKEYKAKILTSAGIGGSYKERAEARDNVYKKDSTKETYTTGTGAKIGLPTYWRNAIYSEEEREKLWLEKLDKQERWVDGIKISIKEGMEEYYKALEIAQAKNKRLGYGTSEIDWSRRNYENERRNLNMKKRLEKFVEQEKNNTFEHE